MLTLAVATATPFIIVNAQIVTFILAVVIPFLVALVTKWAAPAWIKIAFNLVLSAVAAAINLSITATGTAIFSKATLLLAGEQFLTALLVYLGVYKPSNIGAHIAPNFGLPPKQVTAS